MKFAQATAVCLAHWLTRAGLLLGIVIGVLDLTGCAGVEQREADAADMRFNILKARCELKGYHEASKQAAHNMFTLIEREQQRLNAVDLVKASEEEFDRHSRDGEKLVSMIIEADKLEKNARDFRNCLLVEFGERQKERERNRAIENSHDQPVSCTSNTYNGMTYTNCY